MEKAAGSETAAWTGEKKPRRKKEPPSKHKDRLACPEIAEQAGMELFKAIAEQRPFRRDCGALKCLSRAQKIKLAAKAKKTIGQIQHKSFRLKRYLQRRRLTQPFYLLPQHGFATRYFPIDTQVQLFCFILFYSI